MPDDADNPRNEPSPGPDPDLTPGLEPGGGVPPGETPPESSSDALTDPQPKPVGSTWVPFAWITGIAVVVILVACFFVALGIGLIAL